LKTAFEFVTARELETSTPGRSVCFCLPHSIVVPDKRCGLDVVHEHVGTDVRRDVPLPEQEPLCQTPSNHIQGNERFQVWVCRCNSPACRHDFARTLVKVKAAMHKDVALVIGHGMIFPKPHEETEQLWDRVQWPSGLCGEINPFVVGFQRACDAHTSYSRTVAGRRRWTLRTAPGRPPRMSLGARLPKMVCTAHLDSAV
jgi:hypothetical protein